MSRPRAEKPDTAEAAAPRSVGLEKAARAAPDFLDRDVPAER